VGKQKKVEDLIKVRKRKILGRRFWLVMRVLLAVCFLAAAIWGLNYFYNSSYFKIKSLTIEGNTHYDENSLGKFTGDIPGTNIFEVNKKDIEDSLGSGLVWVRSSYRNDYYLLDDEGLILEKISLEDLKNYGDLILVRDAFDHKLDPGEAIAAKNILSCGSIYNIMDEQVRALIEEAGIEENIAGDIFFMTYNNEKIIFGDSNEIIKKIEVLKLLLKQETKYNIIDLRNPDNPVVKE